MKIQEKTTLHNRLRRESGGCKQWQSEADRRGIQCY